MGWLAGVLCFGEVDDKALTVKEMLVILQIIQVAADLLD